jgi:MGT family glycosyltransferase
MVAHSYLAALVDGGGNVPPELGAVRRLVEGGHRVVVLAEASTEREVRASGAAFRSWVRAPNRPDRRPENDVSRDWECTNPLQLFDRLISTQLVGPASGYAADAHDAITETRPDLVICSMFCLGAMVAAESAGTPFDVLFPNIYPLPAEGMPPFGLGLRPARGFGGRLRDRAIGGFTRRMWDAKGLAGINALRVDHGLRPLDHLWEQLHRARRQLIMTSPAFDFPAVLPAGARYVGPVLDDPVWAVAGGWTPPAGDAPLVLVAMSSTYQDQVGCLQRIAGAVGSLPVRAIVTTGLAVDPAALTAPDNVTVVATAPHRPVMEHAALVVTHGGHGTVMKALAAGLPLVVLHHGRDQVDNAARVTAHGAGVAVKRTAKPTAIADAVRIVLGDPSYRRAAHRLGASIRRDASSGALIRELEDLPGRYRNANLGELRSYASPRTRLAGCAGPGRNAATGWLAGAAGSQQCLRPWESRRQRAESRTR